VGGEAGPADDWSLRPEPRCPGLLSCARQCARRAAAGSPLDSAGTL